MSNDLKKKKSDYLLELALEEQLPLDSDMLSYAMFEETRESHVFSAEHEQKMKEIFKIAERIEKRPLRFKRYRQMAAGFLVFFIISGVAVTQVEAFRLPIMKFFTDMKEKSSSIIVEKENIIAITKKYKEYEPQYVPQGFAIHSIDEGTGRFLIKYYNEKNSQSYEFNYMETISDISLDTENANYKETEINGNPAILIQKEDLIRIIMYKDNHQFRINGKISVEESMKIMESIK